MGVTKQDVKSAGVLTTPRRSEEFKRDAVRLVTEEGYTLAAAAQAVGVSEQSLRTWRKKFVWSAAEAVGVQSIGVERYRNYFDLACHAVPRLSKLEISRVYPISECARQTRIEACTFS